MFLFKSLFQGMDLVCKFDNAIKSLVRDSLKSLFRAFIVNSADDRIDS